MCLLDGAPTTMECLIDYGDGTSYHGAPQDFCRMRLPALGFGSGTSATYAAPGTYTVQVHIVLRACTAPGTQADPQGLTLSIPIERVAGPRPTPATGCPGCDLNPCRRGGPTPVPLEHATGLCGRGRRRRRRSLVIPACKGLRGRAGRQR